MRQPAFNGDKLASVGRNSESLCELSFAINATKFLSWLLERSLDFLFRETELLKPNRCRTLFIRRSLSRGLSLCCGWGCGGVLTCGSFGVGIASCGWIGLLCQRLSTLSLTSTRTTPVSGAAYRGEIRAG
jgi:hypothetical protein